MVPSSSSEIARVYVGIYTVGTYVRQSRLLYLHTYRNESAFRDLGSEKWGVVFMHCIVEGGGVKKTLFPAKRILLSYRDTKNTYFHRIDTVSLILSKI